MSSHADKHRAAHEAFNLRDWEGVVRDFADDVTYTDHPRGLTLKSKQEFLDWAKGWTRSFSDGKATDATYYEAPNASIAVFTGTGTNDGPLGPFPASNARLAWPLCEVLRYDEEGRIVEGELFYDMVTMLVQAGHMEAPAAQ